MGIAAHGAARAHIQRDIGLGRIGHFVDGHAERGDSCIHGVDGILDTGQLVGRQVAVAV